MRPAWLALVLAGCVASEAAPPVAGGGGPPVVDDDTFATASATTVPTSESVKAYVDANAGAGLTPAYDTYANCAASTPDGIGDWCQSTDSPYRLESTNGTTWDRTMYPGIGFPVTVPPSASWTARNSASVTAVGGMRRMDRAAGTGVSYKGETRAIPTVPYYVEMCLDVPNLANGETGVWWFQTSDSKFIVATNAGGGAGGGINHQDYTNYTTWASHNAQVTGGPIGEINCWRLEDDNTNRKVYYSSGVGASSTWVQVGTNDARTNHITADHIGWMNYPNEADMGTSVYLVHYATGTP